MIPFHLGLDSSTALSNRLFVQAIGATNVEDSLYLFNTSDGTMVNDSKTFSNYEVPTSRNWPAVVASSDRSLIARQLNQKVQVVTVAKGEKILDFDCGVDVGNNITRLTKSKVLQFHPNNSYLFVRLSQAPFYKIIRVVDGVDISNDLPLAERPTAEISSFRFSPNGNVLVLLHTDGKGMRILDASTFALGGVQPTIQPVIAGFTVCDFKPDSSEFVVSTDATNFMYVYNATTWAISPVTPVHPSTGIPIDMHFSPDGSSLCITHNNSSSSINIYDTTSYTEVANPPTGQQSGASQSCYYEDDGNTLYVAKNTFAVKYDVGNNYAQLGFLLASKGIPLALTLNKTYAQANSEGSEVLLLAGSGGTNRFVEVDLVDETYSSRIFKNMVRGCKSCAVSSSGNRVVVGGHHRDQPYASVYSLPDRTPIATVRNQSIFSNAQNTPFSSIAINSDGTVICLPEDDFSIGVYSVATGGLITSIAKPTSDLTVSFMDYDQTGDYLVVGWRWQFTQANQGVYSYDANNNYALASSYTYTGTNVIPNQVAFRNNSTNIAVTNQGNNNKLYIFDSPANLNLIKNFDGDPNITTGSAVAAYVSGGGEITMSAPTNGFVSVFDADTYSYLRQESSLTRDQNIRNSFDRKNEYLDVDGGSIVDTENSFTSLSMETKSTILSSNNHAGGFTS